MPWAKNGPFIQSLGNGERSHQTLKWALAKLCQETQENWIKLLLIALRLVQSAPRDELKLSAFELMYGRPIPQAREMGHLNLLAIEQPKCALQVGETRKLSRHMVTRCCPHPPTRPPAHPARRPSAPKALENRRPAGPARP